MIPVKLTKQVLYPKHANKRHRITNNYFPWTYFMRRKCYLAGDKLQSISYPLIKLSPPFLLLMRSTDSFCYSVTTESNLFSLCVSWIIKTTQWPNHRECTVLWSSTLRVHPCSLCHPPAASDLGRCSLKISHICLRKRQPVAPPWKGPSVAITQVRNAAQCFFFLFKNKTFACWPVVLVTNKTKSLNRKGPASQADLICSYDKGSPSNFYRPRTFNNTSDGNL